MLKEDFGKLSEVINEIVTVKDDISNLNKEELGEAYFYLNRARLEIEELIRIMKWKELIEEK
ncbi:MAG: hypothetical protein JHC26_05135 [Thermofilum sp.]|uniref:hypothetical protein n=1 Tax=Thermofilum sp. TaxID=1961369 RepID=UPI002588717D|nr:hypothetical protein [Thermofilum sp.]MCI4408454.1 hypothetical protein [Thermofilum sp.]